MIWLKVLAKFNFLVDTFHNSDEKEAFQTMASEKTAKQSFW